MSGTERMTDARWMAVDPGTHRSAWCLMDGDRVVSLGHDPNIDVWVRLRAWDLSLLVIEDIESFGMPVGREVFRTAMWVGRFADCPHAPHRLLPRSLVKLTLCGTKRAKDPNIRAAVIERLGAPSTNAAPNPAYPKRPRGDEWSALALALTYRELEAEGRAGELESL